MIVRHLIGDCERAGLVGQSVKTSQSPTEGVEDAVYQACLPLPAQTIGMVADLIRKGRREIGSR